MSFTEHLAEDRRLALLRVLESLPGYSTNDSVLHTALNSLGHHVSRDTVRGDVAWLTEQALLTSQLVAGSVTVATLTERGCDVAAGRARHPGVKRPTPRS
jgi:Fe2+ or Zn2+ uptake regulation protein